MNKNLYPIRINTLRPNDPVPFDLYVQLPRRFLKYNSFNDELEESRLKNLKKHGVKKLFIDNNDETKYLQYLENGLNILSDKRIGINDRAALANDTMVTSVEKAEKALETVNGYIGQKNQLALIAGFINSDRNALKEMLKTAGISVENNQHSATVSSLSIAIAIKLQMLSGEAITELGYAALLHDYGKSKLKFNTNIPMSKMNERDRAAYKNHPAEGVAMLSGKEFVSPRILGLIASHEEYGVGKGYPDKKDIFKMDVSYQILSLANKYDHFCSENGIELQKGMDPFEKKFGGDFHEKLVQILATVLT